MALRSRASILLGLAAVGAVPAIVCAADFPVVRIGAAPTDATAQHYYARDLGMFGAAGLGVEITALRNAGALSAGVIGGSLDVITGSIVPIAEAHNRGIDLRAIALGNVYAGPPPQGVIVAARDAAIRSGADLNGKTIAVNGLRDLTQVAVQSWIDANGGDSKTVKMLEIPFPGVAAALSQGRIDAAMLVEPFTTSARGQVKILGDGQAAIGKRYMVTGWYARAEWLNANRDTARRLVAVLQQSALWGNRFHAESADILARYAGISADVIRSTTRAVYGDTPITAAMVQPVLDASTKYVGLQPTSAAALLWRA
jgi:NitT/TauT family transport system substrate-binding protein